MSTPFVIQIGFRIDAPRAEAVTINARLYADRARALGCSCRCVGYDGGALTPRRFHRFLRDVAAACREHDSPVVHDFFVIAGVSLLVMAYLRWKRIRVRYVKTFSNHPGGGSRSREGLLRLLLANRLVYRTVARRADAVTYHTPLALDHFVRLPVPPRLEPGEVEEAHRPLRIAYLGHALAKKGIDLLPGIIERVHAARPDAACFRCSFTSLCDRPDVVARLRDLARTDVLAEADPCTMFDWADICIVLIRNSFAAAGALNTVWEGAARACCIVLPELRDPPELIDDRNVVWVEPRTVDAFAEAIVALIDDPGAVARYKRSALDAYVTRLPGQRREVDRALARLYADADRVR